MEGNLLQTCVIQSNFHIYSLYSFAIFSEITKLKAKFCVFDSWSNSLNIGQLFGDVRNILHHKRASVKEVRKN